MQILSTIRNMNPKDIFLNKRTINEINIITQITDLLDIL